MTITRLKLRVMSRMYGNIKSPKSKANKAAVNDRRIIKGWASELFAHKLLGEMIREGYNKAQGRENYNLDQWFEEYHKLHPILNPEYPKDTILRFLHNTYLLNGFAIGKLLRACWVDVEVRIAEVPYRFVYPDQI